MVSLLSFDKFQSSHSRNLERYGHSYTKSIQVMLKSCDSLEFCSYLPTTAQTLVLTKQLFCTKHVYNNANKIFSQAYLECTFSKLKVEGFPLEEHLLSVKWLLKQLKLLQSEIPSHEYKWRTVTISRYVKSIKELYFLSDMLLLMLLYWYHVIISMHNDDGKIMCLRQIIRVNIKS